MTEPVDVKSVHRLAASDLIWRSIGARRFPDDQGYWSTLDMIAEWLANGATVCIKVEPMGEYTLIWWRGK